MRDASGALRGGVLCLLGLACWSWTASARAGGLYLSDRSARALGRGGALVAGAEGLNGIGYNPAAIASAGNGFLMDFGSLLPRVRYTRELAIVGADGTVHQVQSPPVRARPELIAFPTLAASRALGQRWVVAAGLFAPHIALVKYAAEVQGQPSPARYMQGSFTDSRVALPGVWLGFRAHPDLDLGLGVHALVGKFRSDITFSMSLPDRLLAAPEAPGYDAVAAVEVGPIVAPTASAGLLWRIAPALRLGLSGQLPMWIRSPANFAVRIPPAAVFDDVWLEGNRARVRLKLPGVVRAGVEVAPTASLRIELAYVHEFWSGHERIVATPQGAVIHGAPGGPEQIQMPQLVVARNFRDSRSVRLGGRYTLPFWGGRVRLRAGLSHERSAVAPAHLSLGSIDFDKLGFHGGLGLVLGEGWELDTALVYVATRDVYVSPQQAQLVRLNPIDGNAPMESVNGGRYRMGATVLSVGLKGSFGRP